MDAVASVVAERSAFLLRAAGHKAFRGVQEVARSVGSRPRVHPVGSVVMWPPVSTGKELADISARLRWYLAPGCSVDVPVRGGIRPDTVDWFNAEDQTPTPTMRLIDPAAASGAGYEAILIWKHARRELLDKWILRNLPRATVVDPNYFNLTEVGNYLRLANESSPSSEFVELLRGSQQRFAELLSRTAGAERTIVFGTGPSMRDVMPRDVGADVVIACNSAVRDPEWIKVARPDVVAFADPVFHFGPSRYASTFRSDLVRAIKIADSLAVTFEHYLPLIARHLPEIIDRLIVLSSGAPGTLSVPTVEEPSVVRTENILTHVLLPIATAIGTDIAVVGCDGRAPGETRFWRHSTEGQYSDALMTTVADAHPSFFRDRNYGDYYDEHCRTVAAQIDIIEARGLKLTSPTPSMIPALKARM